jgi:transposase-like protein
MTLPDINEMFSTDAQCRALIKKLRWPDGVTCIRCKASLIYDIDTQAKFECGSCGYQFSATTQTIFHDSHLSLEKWFLATLLICESRKGMSANEVKRMLGVSYKTAWYLCHRIRAAMATAEKTMLYGTVEMNETYIGGVQRGHQNKPGHGMSKKQIVIGLRQRSGETRFFHAEDAKSGTLAQYIRDNISEDLDVILTDEYGAYPGAMKSLGLTERHKTIKHKAKIYVDGDIHTNTVENSFSLLKRGIVGTWHRISAKHLAAYLEEMEFRFNRRHSKTLFLDILRHMVTADPLTFEKLTA